jgi:hypothetical protein
MLSGWRGDISATTHQAALPVPRIAVRCETVHMPLILFILLIVLMFGSFGGGFYEPSYRTPGISVGTVLLVIVVLWALGVFGRRPF